MIKSHLILAGYQRQIRQICRSPYIETTTSLPIVGMVGIADIAATIGTSNTHLDLRASRNDLQVPNYARCTATIERALCDQKGCCFHIHTFAGSRCYALFAIGSFPPGVSQVVMFAVRRLAGCLRSQGTRPCYLESKIL